MNLTATPHKDLKVSVVAEFSDWNVQETAKLLVERILQKAEKDERDLAYYTSCRTELARKHSGSYYTPVDVAKFFWNQFFDASGISDNKSASEFLRAHRFIEPACGSGVLVYALFDKLLKLGVSLEVMRDLDLHLIDLNKFALEYSKRQFSLINTALGDKYFSPSLEQADFLRYDGLGSGKPTVVFGNPPFVSNSKGATWKNTFADFLDRCLEEAAPLAAIHFIVPLSLAFSRDYSALRHKMRAKKLKVYASHFDNIPDTLFKSGKPQSENTNKANSQRCTIISAFAAKEHRLFSSKMHRWCAADRGALLSSRAHFDDVTDYSLGDQFIRPSSTEMAKYLQSTNFKYSLGDLVQSRGRHYLFIGSVARNYISVRGEAGSGIQAFAFEDRQTFYKFLGLITSDVFMEYWRSVGDGFHVTRANILDFPVSATLDELAEASVPKIKSMWARRKRFEKTKQNSGALVRSYDFSGAVPSFRHVLSLQLTNDQIKMRNNEESIDHIG